jgi:hypothetical protein
VSVSNDSEPSQHGFLLTVTQCKPQACSSSGSICEPQPWRSYSLGLRDFCPLRYVTLEFHTTGLPNNSFALRPLRFCHSPISDTLPTDLPRSTTISDVLHRRVPSFDRTPYHVHLQHRSLERRPRECDGRATLIPRRVQSPARIPPLVWPGETHGRRIRSFVEVCESECGLRNNSCARGFHTGYRSGARATRWR